MSRLSEMPVAVIVDLIRNTQGKLAKQAILAQAMKENATFKPFLNQVFNPFLKYGIQKIPQYDPSECEGITTLQELLDGDFLGNLTDRVYTGRAAHDYLEGLLQELTAVDAAALEMIIRRDLDCGVSVSSINKAEPKFIKTFPVMLCSPFNQKLADQFVFPAISQTKEDGLRGNLVVKNGVVNTFSRNGKDLGLDDVFAFIGEKFSDDSFVLDGEVLVRNEAGTGWLPRKTSNGIINKCAQGTASEAEMKRVVFVCWDLIDISAFENDTVDKTTTADRFVKVLMTVAAARDPRLVAVDSRMVASLVDAKAHFAEMVEQGREGTILKTMSAPWASGRPKTQLKFKCENECDLIVVSLNEGVKKNVGKMGAAVCQTRDGLLKVNVGTGWSDEERERFWKNPETIVGKILATKYNEKIQSSGGSWSLFLPRAIEVRFDKTTADALSEIV